MATAERQAVMAEFLICEKCGQEVRVYTTEAVCYHYEVGGDGEVNWHEKTEDYLGDIQSTECKCGCEECPYYYDAIAEVDEDGKVLPSK